MRPQYWQRQTKDKLLFPDLEWSRPETKRHAGKQLIIGGSSHGFSAPASAYTASEQAGVGTTRVLLPDSVQKLVGGFLPEAIFCPSNPSGSFAASCLGEWLEQANWADGVLIAGDIGRNSETTSLLEKFIVKHKDAVTLTGDSTEHFLLQPEAMINRPETTLVLDFVQLQKIATAAKFKTAFTSTMDFMHFVEAIHDFSLLYKAEFIVPFAGSYCIAVNGQVSTTKTNENTLDNVRTAAFASVWRLQHDKQPFQALTASIAQL